MRAVKISVKPFEFIEILDMSMSKGLNRHGQAYVKGIIADDAEERYVTMPLYETAVEITASDFAGNECILFHGMLEAFKITTQNDMRVMELSLVSKSRMLDTLPQITVFQDTDLTYNQLVKATLESFPGAQAIINCGSGARIGQMFVRYKETAWEFLIRMASMHNDVIVVNDTLPDIKLYFGFPRKSASSDELINPISYHVKKAIGGYIYKRENRVSNVSESDAEQFVVKEREIRQIGECVEFLNRKLWVTNIESKMEGVDLVHTYTLMREAGVKTTPKRNFNIIGASLSGSVGAVSGTHVKMILDHAHSNVLGDVKWHVFSTVHSSADGTGWHVMPVAGDTLRLYFGTEIEDAGYMVSAVHTSETQPGFQGVERAISTQTTPSERMPARSRPASTTSVEGSSAIVGVVEQETTSAAAISNDIMNQFEFYDCAPRIPNRKVYANDAGQMLVMSPGYLGLELNGNGPRMLVSLVANSSVAIISSSDISMTGGNDVLLSAEGQVVVNGSEKVSVSQEAAAVKLEGGNVTFTGTAQL